MPRSKHRRKPGGKSLKRPGHHNRPVRQPPISARETAHRRFTEAYRKPFLRQWPDAPACVADMLDLVAGAVFDANTSTFRAVSKDWLFRTVLAPLEAEDGSVSAPTADAATAALRFLVEQNMVTVAGDRIAIHPRFADLFAGSPASSDATEGPMPAW